MLAIPDATTARSVEERSHMAWLSASRLSTDSPNQIAP
jgi:hypothetical protein